MSSSPCDGECAETMRTKMAAMGVEVHVSTLPLLAPSDYEDGGLTCPHGVRYYMQPTTEQVIEWRRDGVR